MTVLIMDQLDTEDSLRTYSKMAHPKFFVILLASANFPYFHEKPITVRPQILPFAFAFEGSNWSLMLKGLEKKKKLESPTAEIKFDESQLAGLTSVVPFNLDHVKKFSIALTDTPDMGQLFSFMNGHPLTMAMYALGEFDNRKVGNLLP